MRRFTRFAPAFPDTAFRLSRAVAGKRPSSTARRTSIRRRHRTHAAKSERPTAPGRGARRAVRFRTLAFASKLTSKTNRFFVAPVDLHHFMRDLADARVGFHRLDDRGHEVRAGFRVAAHALQ